MISDDATPEELERWYRRTPQDIENEQRRQRYEAWAALRLPEHLAREPDTLSGGAGQDRLIGGAGADLLAKKAVAAAASPGLDPYQQSFLDALSAREATGYDVLYTPRGQPTRRIRRGPDGQADYRQHPNDPAIITEGPYKGLKSSAAGRYQFNKNTWDELAAHHPDLVDFTPDSQNRGAWYLASEEYHRKTKRDLATDLRDSANYPQIAGALNKRWTSLPGGSQQGQALDEFGRRLNAGIQRYQSRP